MRASVGLARSVEADDRIERTAHEQRLEHHLVPGLFRQLLGGIGVAVRHGLEHHLHVGAQAFGTRAGGAAPDRGRRADRGRTRPVRRRRRSRTAGPGAARRHRRRLRPRAATGRGRPDRSTIATGPSPAATPRPATSAAASSASGALPSLRVHQADGPEQLAIACHPLQGWRRTRAAMPLAAGSSRWSSQPLQRHRRGHADLRHSRRRAIMPRLRTRDRAAVVSPRWPARDPPRADRAPM